jgi:rsbT co-antagonist protein RsbR
VQYELFDEYFAYEEQRIIMTPTQETLQAENAMLKQRITELEQQNAALQSTGGVQKADALSAESPDRLLGDDIHNLFVQTPVPVCVFRGPEHVYEMVNEEYLTMINHRDVLGKSLREAWPEAAGQGFYELFDQIYSSGEPFHIHESYASIDRDQSGELQDAWFHLVYQPFRNAQGEVVGIFHIALDMTEQIQAQRELDARNQEIERLNVYLQEQHAEQRRSQVLLESVINNSPSIIYAKDTKWNLTLANEQFARLLNQPRDQLVGKNDYDLFPAESIDAIRANDQQVLASGQPISVEETLTLEDGLHTYLSIKFPLYDAYGKIHGVGGITSDITQRKQAEDELRLFKTLVDNAPDGIAVSSPDGTVTHANPAFQHMLGYGAEVLGMHASAFTDPSSVQAFASAFQTVQQAGSWQGELTYLRADGSTFPGTVSSFLVRDEQGETRAVAAIIRDITERQQMEQAMRESEQRLRFILEGSNDGAWDMDLKNGASYYSPRYAEMLGYATEEFGNTSDAWLSRIHPDDAPLVNQMFADYLAGKTAIYESEHRLQHRSGEWRWVLARGKITVRDEQGNPTRITGTISDITERKQVEQQLQIFNALVENAPDGVCVVNPSTNAIWYANSAYRTMVGYGDEIIGMEGSELLAIDREQFATINADIQTHNSWQGVIPCQRKDGDRVPTHQSIFLIFDQQQNVQALAVIARDITEQQKQEEERLALQEQIIEAQRAALRELSSPLIPIADNVVIMPLIGSIDSGRAQQVMESLLEGVAHHQAETAILDITGVSVVDTQVANALIQAAQAVKLLGAQVVLTGIGPAMAQTLVGLGADLSSIVTRGNLQSGIAYAIAETEGKRSE